MCGSFLVLGGATNWYFNTWSKRSRVNRHCHIATGDSKHRHGPGVFEGGESVERFGRNLFDDFSDSNAELVHFVSDSRTSNPKLLGRLSQVATRAIEDCRKQLSFDFLDHVIVKRR